jgi:rhodanese-related sulfurtransferase
MNELPLEIDCQSVKALRDRGEPVVVVDCRTQGEWDVVHLDDAKFMPMHELADRVGELEPHRDQRVVVHCHHGGRSLRVVHWLRQQGFLQAQNMTGGIDAWAVEIDPTLPRY